MAVKSFGASDFQTQTQWAEGTEAETLKKAWVTDFMGKGPNALLQKRTELQKRAGDTLRISLRMLETGAPISLGTLEGNEATTTYHGETILLNKSRCAARMETTMSAQRAAINLREEGRGQVSDQHANALDTSFFNQIAGFDQTGGNETTFEGLNTAIAPSANQHIWTEAGVTDDQSLTSAGTFDINNLDVAIEKAKTQTPSIRPAHISWMNQDLYVCFIHPFQMTSLRASSSVFEAAMQSAMRGGAIANNPLFAGTSVVWNGCLVVESTRVPNGLHDSTKAVQTNVRRAIFCGAQAAQCVYGRSKGMQGSYNWVERDFDYGDQYGVAATAVYGLKKTIFNSLDFATIVIASWAAASAGS